MKKQEAKKKKIAFLHLGESRISAKYFAKEFGFEFVDLPKTNKKTINNGLLVSPEFSCFPFKSVMGGFVEAAKLGAEILCIPSSNSIGACQFSDFAMAQKYILEKHGYNIEFLKLNLFKPGDAYSKLKSYKKNLTLKRFSEIMIVFSQKFLLMDDVKQYSNKIYFLAGKKEANKFMKKFEREVDKTDFIMDLYLLGNRIKDEYSKYDKSKYDNVVKIGVVGDICVINDKYLNNNIFERIFDLGAYAENGISPSVMYESSLFSTEEIFGTSKEKKYLKHNIGGYSQHTLKQTIKFAEQGFDGVIHVYPFNCMPETSVRSILPKVSKDYDIPILYLPIDELTGDAGFATRLEAFVDLLNIKKRKQDNKIDENTIGKIKNYLKRSKN